MSLEGNFRKIQPNEEEQEETSNVTFHKDGVHNGSSPATANSIDVQVIPEKKEKEKLKQVGALEIFRFSDGLDKLLMVIGTLCAMAHGAILPSLMIIFGEMIEFFVDTGKVEQFLDKVPEYLTSVNISKNDILSDIRTLGPLCPDIDSYYNYTISCNDISVQQKILDEMTTYAIYFCAIASGLLLVGYLQMVCWVTAAQRQANRIRCSCLRNILYQDIGWFDTHEVAELNTRLSDDIIKIQEGIGDKVGALIQWTSCFIAGFVIGFIYGWKLTLVILAVSPLLAGSAGVMGKLLASFTTKELEAYAKAGSVAEEVFGSIKTVISFGGQDKEIERYRSNLDDAYTFGVKKGLTNGLLMGTIWCVVYCVFALGFWYSGKLYREDDAYGVSNVLVVFFSVITAAFGIGNAGPGIQAFSTGRGAAYTIYELIDLKSKINSDSTEGEKLSPVSGLIEFKDIHFNYPSRPDVNILNGLDISAVPGQKVALIGSSGCGKSTVMQLLLRFYNPDSGEIFIDGKNVKDLNLRWLRQSIGLVSQEPILFATTIAENLRYGREDVTMEEMIQAAKDANAYNFIKELPKEFETFVGEQGAQLSGGQKQRLAIARALVRNPKILLLDEATSALDTESESIVQDALDRACAGRTTLIIAHRLSTIKNADIIVGFDQGKIAEKGTHDELMAKQGIYYQLVTTQQYENQSEEDDEIKNIVEKDSKTLVTRELSNSGATATKKVEEPDKDKKEKETLPDAPFGRLMKMNAPEWYFILLGCFGALVNGGLQPAFAVIFSEILSVFTLPYDEMEDKMLMYCLIFLGIGFGSLFTMFLQGYMFARSGESLTKRLRDMSFSSMLRQDIAWYDDDKNTIGALTTRLSTDASLVQGVTGVRLGSVFMSLSNIGTAIVIAFIYGWKMTLLIIGFVPFFVLAGFVEVRQQGSQSGKIREALEGAGKITVESIGNIRTVASLTREDMFYTIYRNKLKMTTKNSLRNTHLLGIVFGFSEAIVYYAYAGCFTFGAYLIEEGEMSFDDVFLVFSVLVFGAMGLGNATAFVPDAGKAKVSSQRIIMILDSQPSLDYTSTGGRELLANYTPKVIFQDVHFSYPTRKTVPVLKGLNLSVSPGKTMALVGSSGCGKSTSVQLMERFYDTDSGQVCVDGNDIKSLNIQWLRSQIGIVSQEPVLFDRSIGENIAYGDNSRVVSMDEVIEAARGANIHSFISSLPDGYNTNVGAKGTQLSGGQKQRVAIARALVRNPKILLLDEATSALDTESEQIVQEALDKARENRTCIVIAHRLSTIRNVDEICVISHGKVSEVGTHNELMTKQGFYHKLVKNSMKQA